MHVGEISFCDRVAYNIKSEDTKRYILNTLEKKYNLRIIHRHHEKFDESKSLSILKSNPHMVCVRSNGNPYFLYLMKYNFIQYCVFIDKKIQQGYYLPRIIIVQAMFEDSLFEDTVMDGEMIKSNNGRWYYLINDLLVCKGQHLHDMNHPRRMTLLYDILEKGYTYDECDAFRIGVKSFFKYNEIEKLLTEYIPSLPYTTRGLYFKPLYMRFKDILYNFDENLIKKVDRVKYKNVKQFILNNADIEHSKNKDSLDTSDNGSISSDLTDPIETSSSVNISGINVNQFNNSNDNIGNMVDIIKTYSVRKTSTPDVYDIFDGNNNIGIACIPSMKISKQMREVTKDLNMIDKVEIEFKYSQKFKKWMPNL